MPIYEYHCEQCGHDFETVLTISQHSEKEEKKQIHCPKCDSTNVRHLVEPVYVTTSRKS